MRTPLASADAVRIALLSALVCVACAIGCSSSGSTPEGACTPSDPSCVGGSDAGHDSAPALDGAHGDANDSNDAADASCKFPVDDAGVTHGCGGGDNGPGDRDEGGDAGPPPPPDASRDASDLPLGAPCWDNAQCASDMCFDYVVKGTFCTKPCSSNADCPSPTFMGCNGMGVCRIPD
jgi:hypothetical protein